MKKVVFSLCLIGAVPLFAQVDPQTSKQYGLCADIDGVLSISKVTKPESAEGIKKAIQIGRGCNLSALQQYILDHPPDFSPAQQEILAQQLLAFVEQARQDKQVGASDSSAGTTSLVSKGVGAIVGVALESGSISRSTSGNTTTVTINSGQAANFLSAGNISPCALIEPSCGLGRKFLTALTIATNFNVSQANTSTSSTAAQDALSALVGSNTPAFSGASARLDFNARKKDVTLDQLMGAYRDKSYLEAAAAYAAAVNDLSNKVVNDQKYLDALQGAMVQLQKADSDGAVNGILQTLKVSIANLIRDNAADTTAFQLFASTQNTYRGARDLALGTVLNKWTGSFEYDFNRLPSQPDQSDFKVIYSYRGDARSSDRILQISANAAATIYDSLEGSTTSRVRSAQAAFQVDYTAASAASKVQAAITGGYYFQYMIANGLLTLPASAFAPGTAIPLPGNASELLNTTGPIHIGQGKITLSLKGTSVNIPLALTFSNRTDLIKASRVGGNFGITYDFNSLLAKAKAK
jgi:hypothetical protein